MRIFKDELLGAFSEESIFHKIEKRGVYIHCYNCGCTTHVPELGISNIVYDEIKIELEIIKHSLSKMVDAINDSDIPEYQRQQLEKRFNEITKEYNKNKFNIIK